MSITNWSGWDTRKDAVSSQHTFKCADIHIRIKSIAIKVPSALPTQKDANLQEFLAILDK
ncbi:hypothetical protein J25TS5_05720 [Paenibacillus faecis]|nr:hypothetical protein J25TS5_05720 [Paenibacillus faecis]